MPLFAALISLLLVHGPKGQPIQVNPKTISNIREVTGASQEHVTHGTKCILFLTNGKFIATAETCQEIVAKIAELK